MKRILITLAICLLAFTCAGCGGSSSKPAEEKPVKETDALKGSITLKQALDKKGTRVWYNVASLDGRHSKVLGVYAFTDGKMILYDIYDLEKKSLTSDLGTLEDYYSLSDEDALSLAIEKYNAAYEEYYSRLDTELDGLDEKMADYNDSCTPDEQRQALTETRDQIRAEGMADKTPQPYSLHAAMDSSGNNIESETIQGKRVSENTYRGIIERGPMFGMELYEVIPGKTEDIYIHSNKGLEPMEVYDVNYGGYCFENEGRRGLYFITKCDPETVFTIDAKGTKGLEIDN